jgi:hypothetical protein
MLKDDIQKFYGATCTKLEQRRIPYLPTKRVNLKVTLLPLLLDVQTF